MGLGEDCEKRRTRAFTPWEVKERNVLEGSGRTGKQRTTEPWGALDLAHPLALLCPNPQSPGQSAVAVLLAVRSGQWPPNHLGLWEDLCSKVDPHSKACGSLGEYFLLTPSVWGCWLRPRFLEVRTLVRGSPFLNHMGHVGFAAGTLGSGAVRE